MLKEQLEIIPDGAIEKIPITESSDKIDSLFARAVRELEAKRRTFARLQEDPELILKELFDPARDRPYYAFPFLVFERCRELGLPGCEYHWLQDYLVGVISRHLQGIDPDIEVVAQGQLPRPEGRGLQAGAYCL
ncbi:hypothetical protein SAMN00808754_1404 [Thermanaeromonas toyohensis ToBE]|uniref:Uncharacterized protein n=1 Tax=Thermanaeromonas toyohensis ToBE TaxID=698762 RepID=A0A1W1VRY0_9FIRM|nr:hypothetical protein [Thermanaeromonas toyohensis]SMB96117.1 hypothetical protein SAMN00808754_1404 [Thermanaeromonas toyohensis ToBE]